MNSRIARLLMTCAATSMLTACGPSIYSLRVPLNDTATLSTVGGSVTIDDQRPEAERKVHTGGGLISFRRHYGDETYVPAKVECLRQLLQARVPPFPQIPAYNPEYVVLFKRAFDEIADEIVAGESFRP